MTLAVIGLYAGFVFLIAGDVGPGMPMMREGV
jgi:hypothetical protein